MAKDEYVFQFDTQKTADYWMKETYSKLKADVVAFDKTQKCIEFIDSKYYFWSRQLVSQTLYHATVYGSDAIPIILDDPERHKQA